MQQNFHQQALLFSNNTRSNKSKWCSTYYAHEVGNNEVDSVWNKTAIPAFIQSGDFDLSQEEMDNFYELRRFIPDFKLITGDAQITINLRKISV